MSIYASDAQLYACFQSLFGTIEGHDPKAADALLKASLAITFNCTSPTASITIDARRAPLEERHDDRHADAAGAQHGNAGDKPQGGAT